MSQPELLVIYSHSAGQNVRAKELPQQGKTLLAQSWQCHLDGAKGTNVAVAAARLGTATALISRTGNDFWGRSGRSSLGWQQGRYNISYP